MKTASTIPLYTTTTVDLNEFDALYHQYHQAVYANIWKMVRQHEVAEDILQEVFLALWENREKLEADRVAGWLFVISYNKAVKHLKKKMKQQALPLEKTALDDNLLPDEPVSEEWYSLQLSMVEDAVKHLPERKRQVFHLCRYEGKSHDEVATLLGISVLSVKDYLKQSTRFIKDYISEHYTEGGTAIASLLVLYLSDHL